MDRSGIGLPPVRLESDEHIAVHDSGQELPVSQSMDVPRRLAPTVDELLADGLGQLGEPFGILLLGHEIDRGRLQLHIRGPVFVIGHAFQQAGDQFLPVLGHPIKFVTGVLHVSEYLGYALQCVETVSPSRQILPRRVHVDEDSDLLLRFLLVTEHRPPICHLGKCPAPVLEGHLHIVAVRLFLGPAVGRCIDLPVELGTHHAVCDLRGSEAEGTLLPFGGASHEVDGLQDRDVQALEEIVLGDLLPAAGLRQHGERESHGVQGSIQYGLPVTDQIFVDDPAYTERPRQGVLVTVEEQCQRFCTCLFDRFV